MNKKKIETVFEDLIDELASIEHERWAHWQRYVHSQAKRLSDGSLVIPADLVEKWEVQIGKPFQSLTESEKESDREQVRKYLPTIKNALER